MVIGLGKAWELVNKDICSPEWWGAGSEDVGTRQLQPFSFQDREGMEFPGTALRRSRMWPTSEKAEQTRARQFKRNIV